MRWIEDEQGICLKFDDPVTWVWLLQLAQLLREEPGIPDLSLTQEDDLYKDEHWQEWVKPELEQWQHECFEVVEEALKAAAKMERQERALFIRFEQMEAWTEVLGRARLIMEQRWNFSSLQKSEMKQRNSLDHSQTIMRFHFYGMLEERLVLKLAEQHFPDEQDPLGYEDDINQLSNESLSLEENHQQQAENEEMDFEIDDLAAWLQMDGVDEDADENADEDEEK